MMLYREPIYRLPMQGLGAAISIDTGSIVRGLMPAIKNEMPGLVGAAIGPLKTHMPTLVGAAMGPLKSELPGLINTAMPQVQKQLPGLVSAAMPVVQTELPKLLTAAQPVIAKAGVQIMKDPQIEAALSDLANRLIVSQLKQTWTTFWGKPVLIAGGIFAGVVFAAAAITLADYWKQRREVVAERLTE